jgi:hypothetical protein
MARDRAVANEPRNALDAMRLRRKMRPPIKPLPELALQCP